MKLPHEVSLALRSQIAKATTVASAAEPLRLVIKRKVPLRRQGEQLGHLEVLLRLSCHGKQAGYGVLVFEWPTRASGHSAVRMLEDWSDRCGPGATCRIGELELQRREALIGDEGSIEVPGVHFKVKFPLAEIPNALLELLDLAAQAGLADAVRMEIERRQRRPDKAPLSNSNPVADPRSKAANPNQDQAMIEKIVHNAVFDPKVHPHVNPNEEVSRSDGTTFRLVVKRVGGVPKRTWIHVRNGIPR